MLSNSTKDRSTVMITSDKNGSYSIPLHCFELSSAEEVEDFLLENPELEFEKHGNADRQNWKAYRSIRRVKTVLNLIVC